MSAPKRKNTIIRLVFAIIILVHGIFIFRQQQFYPGFFLPKFKNRDFRDSVEVSRISFQFYQNDKAQELTWKDALKPYDKRYFRYIIEHWRSNESIHAPIKESLEQEYGKADSIFFCLEISHWTRKGELVHQEEKQCEAF